MKKAYLEEWPVELSANSKKTLMQSQWVDTSQFLWGDKQKRSFQAVKETISTNLMDGANPEMQYHLATDASKQTLENVLFQLQNASVGIEAINSYKDAIQIIMFMFFWLEDVKTWYTATECKILAVVRYLAKVK